MLNNRKESEVKALRGVITAIDAPKLQFGQFTSLQNWVPAKKTSIKKKRGVALLDNAPGELLNFQQNWTCGECTPEPASQTFTLLASVYPSSVGFGNCNFNTGRIHTFDDGSDEIYTYIYDMGASGAYSDPRNGLIKINIAANGQFTYALLPKVPPIDDGGTGNTSTQGKSDVNNRYGYFPGIFGSNNVQLFDVQTNQAFLMGPVPSSMVSNDSATTWGSGKVSLAGITANFFWAEHKGSVYMSGRRHGSEGVVVRWDAATGTALEWTDTLNNHFGPLDVGIGQIQVTDKYVYVMIYSNSTNRICRLTPTSMTFVDSFILPAPAGGTNWTAFHVFGDNIIYLADGGSGFDQKISFFNISTNGPVRPLGSFPTNDALGAEYPDHNMIINGTSNGDMYLYFIGQYQTNGSVIYKVRFRCF